MGRRALPKLDPGIDFSEYITEVDDLVAQFEKDSQVEQASDAVFDPQSFFDKPRDLEIEIGSGKGLFILNESGRVPERNFLGNEIAKKYCAFAAYRLAKAGRNNAHMLRGDGLKFFRELMPDNSAVAVHVYFPDPWWKERHRRRRVIQPGFIADMQRVLKPGGIFHFWTDVEEYFEQTIEMMKTHSDLSNPIHVPEPPSQHDMDYRTHFERRMRKNDHDVFRCQFHKT